MIVYPNWSYEWISLIRSLQKYLVFMLTDVKTNGDFNSHTYFTEVFTPEVFYKKSCS